MKKLLIRSLSIILMVLPMVTMAQLSPSGQVKVITPNVLSACARDTIWLELTNNDGPTCNTGAGPVQTVQFDITHPGTGQIFYQPASVGSETNIASEVSYTGNTLSMTMEVPSFGNTNRAYFVLNATCDVTDVSTLPQLDITANYPTAFPVTTESFKSAKMNIGVGEITFTHASSSYINTVRRFNQTINHAQYITNTGFGRITELTYHQIVHDSLTGSIQNKDWAYIRRVSPSVLSPFSLGMDAYPDYQMTNLGNGYRYISFTIKGAQLDREDGQFDPGDRIQINASYLRAPSTCIAPMNQTQWVTYNCVGSGTACAEPDSLVKTFRISAGTPVVAAVNSTVEAWDGCPEKAASFTFKNTGAGSSSNPEVGTAYDVDLGLTFNGKLSITNMVVGTSTIVPTTPTNLSGAKSLVWDIKDKLTFDPDGPGGLQDLDGDSFFDDMRPGDSTLISFNYTVDCDLACGADLEYDIKGTSKYTDYCRVLNSSRSTSIYQFGFEQTAPISQTTPLPNYGTMSGSSKETRVGDFTFNYTLDNVDTTNAIMKLRINYSNTMQVIEPINFLGSSLTLADFTVIGAGSTDTTNGNYNPVTDVDSALEYTLTKAQIALVFDNTLDSLSYAMTHISCDSFQNQGNSDGWELLFQTTNTPCAINSMEPCTLDLACNKGFAYNVSEGCGTKPCYNVTDTIYRTSPHGFTNEDGTTPVIPTAAGASKFYEGDTLTFLRTATLNADWPIMEPTTSLAISRGANSYFTFSFNKDPNVALLDVETTPFLFIPTISRVRIRDTSNNTLIADLPLEFKHFDDYSNGSLNVTGNRITKLNYLNNVTDNVNYGAAPDNNSVVGTGIGDYYCYTNSWAIDPANCPYADLRGRAQNTIVYSAIQSDDGTRMTERYYLYVEEALKEANIVFDPGYKKYQWEIETKWLVNPDFPHNNVAGMLERGGFRRVGNNISPAPSGTYMGTCGGTKQAVATVVTKEIEVANARKTYSSACGLTICNEVEFKSPAADYFPAEVRIPFKLDSFVVDMPVEYHLTAAPTFGGAAMGAANSIEANGPTIGGGLSGHLVFTNNTANSGTAYPDFPRISDADGNQVAWQVCYPVSNVGSDNFVTESYKIPVTYYARDEFDNIIVLVDTFSITEATPAITVAPLGSTVKIDDGGSCKDSYMDLLVSNNTTYAADNVIVAVNSTTNSTVTNIQLLNLSGSATQLTDTNWYGMSNLYAELGGMAAGDRKTIRVYFNTTMCEDSLKIITNFGCNYPVNQEPDYTSPDLDSAFISFNSVDGGILSGPKDGNKEITDLCTIQTLEVEVRNVRNPNLTNILAAIKLPPNAVYVANSAEIAYPENIYENATVVTLTGTDSLTIDISADPELANACGLPGADESSFPASLNNANDANVFLFKFDVDFSACPTATVDEVTYNVTAENYCGTETSTNGIFNFIYVGTTGTPNTFSCTSVSAEPLPICADSGMTNTITDDLWIKNETGPATSTGNIVKITLANDTAAYDLSNFSVAAPWSAPIITTSASNRTVLEFVVPAGIPADDSVMLSLTYDITPKVSDLCNQLNSNCADVAYSVSFFSQVDVSCPAKSLNCPSLGQESRGSSYVPRDLKCCPQGLGDYVWLDENQDGIQNANEVGVAGVNVDLYNNGPDGLPNTADDELVGSTVTDAYGHYYFNDLPIGSYNLGFTPPANYTFTNPVAAGDNSFPTNSEVDNTQGSPNYGRTGTYVLTTTEQDSTIDVGLILPPPPVKASVGNYVWFDADQDGIQDPNESGIAGVVVELLDASGNVVATTTTDGNGMYLFDNVDPGDYSVQFSEPIGMVPTANNGAIGGATNSDADPTTLTSTTFTVMAGDSITYVDAGFHLQDPNNASLGDKVFYDTNNDGIQDPGEAGVPNVTVYLYAGDGTTVLDSAVTDALGNYLFNNLPAGDYVVGFEPSSLPSGFAFSPQGVGANDALNSDANPATGKTNVITLMAGDKNMTVDAGIDNPSLTNSIGDYVWNDVNKDGIQDANEPAVAGVTVTLYDAAGVPIATTITDADGYYLFPELPNGTFSVGFSNLPPGYGFTAQDATADNADSDADPATGKTASVTLTGNTNITDLDAGIYQTGSSSGTASLGDKIWVDLNNDNLQDENEPGVAGVTVYLYAADGTTVLDSTVTDGQGNYIFTDLPAGGYVVGFNLADLPAGYTPVTQDAGGATANANNLSDANDSDADATTGKTAVINLAPGDDNLGIDLGVTPPAGTASLGNYVWYDENQDGIQDPTEVGVQGVQVNLLNSAGEVVGTTTTNNEGYYSFTGLTPGDYSVEFSQIPSGYEFTAQDAGSDDALDSDVDPITGTTTSVTLAANENNTSLDAGIFSNTKAALGDYVWFDSNGDGIQDPTEEPIPGVLVTLYDATGTTPIATTVTDANGKYWFPNLDPSVYVVGFSDLPLGTEFTTQETGSSPDGSDVNPSTGKTAPIVLSAGEVNPNIDAGVKTTELAGLGNYVWNDLNEDGVQDPDEPGVAGVVVTLYAPDGVTVLGTTVTDGEGAYSFTNIPAGDYIVGFSELPLASNPTINSGGVNDSLNSDLGVGGKTTVITLAPGEYNPNIDAGIIFEPQGLGNFVWLDNNKDGVQDPGEPGVAGVQVDIFSNGPDGLPNTADDVLVGSTTTDGTGYYYFPDLATGKYNLGFTPPANYTFTDPIGAGDNSLPDNSDVNNTVGSPNFGRTGTFLLTAGEQDSTIDAGLILPDPPVKATVGNYVWFDTDKDGIQDANESGLSGVTVSLLDAMGNVVATTITDGTGMYLFDDVDPGTYTVQFTQPVGMKATANTGGVTGETNSDVNPNTLSTLPFVVNAGDSIRYVDAGFYPQDANKASLGDRVWYDANNDGIQDPGEAGAPGITVNLYAANGTTILATTTTDALGNYVFNDLPAGDYVVGFDPTSLPSGFVFTPQNAGSDSTKNSDANTTTGQTAVITLAPGEKNMTIDAGIDNPTLTNSIGDYVWNDLNNDGIQDANEPSVAGVTVTLYDNLGNPVGTTVTDENGFYLFPELANGSYNVGFSNLPVGYTFTKKDATANNLDSDVNPITGQTNSVVLTGNTNIRDLDAGIFKSGTSSGTASLGDKVWIDLNGDNLQDQNEPGLAGVTVYLYDATGTNKLDSTVTDGQGNYIFTNLPGGTYVVGFDLNNLPAGYTIVTPDAGGAGSNTNDGTDNNDSDVYAFNGQTAPINLAPGDDNLSIDLGVTPPAGTASLGNYVWYDVNKDGIQDATEVGVQGVQVDLLNTAGEVIGTTTTDGNGYYGFAGLAPGDYSVQFSQIPSGYNLTSQDAGSDDGLDSDANPTTGVTAPVTLGIGENNPSLDAGIYSDTKAGLGDYVWFDTNGDGIQDPTEQPIPGIIVTLYDATGTTPIATTMTDAEGKYFFPNLDPAIYVVGFDNLPIGTEFTEQESGNSPTGSNVDPTTGKTAPINLLAGEINTTIDAGVKTTETAGLGNFVWNDLNEDGVQDPGEPGIAGVIVILYAQDGVTEIGRTITDGDGGYSFTNLPAGDYIVEFNGLPDGYTPTVQSGGIDNPTNSDLGPGDRTAPITLLPGEYNPHVDAGIYIGTPLPADALIATVAVLNGKDNCDVNWYTVSEKFTDHFEIERSTNLIDWKMVGTKKASVETTNKTDYRYTDNIFDIPNAKKIFYRIKLVDIDQQYSYSNVISVDQKMIASGEEEAMVYPTLFNDNINVQYTALESSIIRINLTDLSGRVINKYEFDVNEGVNKIAISDLNQLAVGTYYLNIVNNYANKQFVIKLLKK